MSAGLLVCAPLVGSAEELTNFKPATAGYRYAFPRDHGSHPEYASEWWYYTGHLKTAEGRRFGYQLTWFRFALAPTVKRASKWAARDIYFAHFALTDEEKGRFLFTDTIQRGALNLSGGDDGRRTRNPKIWVGNWVLQYGGKAGETQTLMAAGKSDSTGAPGIDFGAQLSQVALKPPVIQGENGISIKSAGVGHASHYYSFTRLKTKGTLSLEGEKYPVEGESWFDHEFGSGQMAESQVGWDWFSLQLGDGRELMLYRLRLKDGGVEPYSSGTLVDRTGRSKHLPLKAFQMEPQSYWTASSGVKYPARWKVRIPGEAIELQVEPVLADQELRPRRSLGGAVGYWEGSVRVSGTANGKVVTGAGYVEMTGYRRPMAGLF